MLYISIIISLMIMFVSFLMFKRAFGTMNITQYMPFMHLFYFQILLMTLIGIEFIYGGIYSDVLKDFGVTKQSIVTALLAVWYSTVAISVVLMVSLRNMKNQTKAFWENPMVKEGLDSEKEFFFVCTLVAVLCVVHLYLNNAPIFQVLKGNMGSVLAARVAYNRNFGGSHLIKNVLGESISVLVAYITYLYYRTYKTGYWRLTAVINFCCGFLISGASLSKSGIVLFIIPYMFLLVCSGEKIQIGKYVKLGILCMFFLVIMYSVQTKGMSGGWRVLLDFRNGPLGRILYVQIQSLPAYFMIFPRLHPFTVGQGISFLQYIGMPHIEAARVVAQYLEPAGVASGRIGVANTLYIGDAYANFGWLGVLLAPVIVACLYAFFYKKLVNSEKTPMNVAVHITILYSLTNAYTGGFCSGYLVNTRIIAILLLMASFYVYRSIRARKHRFSVKVWT